MNHPAAPHDPAINTIFDQLETNIRTVNYGVTDGITTTYAIITADDGESGPAPKRELARLAHANDALEEAATRAPAADDTAERVDVVQLMATGAAAMRTVLLAQGSFPDERAEMISARALALQFFPSSDAISRRKPKGLWLTVGRMLTKVKESAELAHEVEYLVGAWAVEILEPLHERAGRLLGITAAPITEAEADQLEKLRAHREQLGAYERAVLGEVDEQDPASVSRAAKLLAPLTALRSEVAARVAAAAAATRGKKADEKKKKEEMKKKEEATPTSTVPAEDDDTAPPV